MSRPIKKQEDADNHLIKCKKKKKRKEKEAKLALTTRPSNHTLGYLLQKNKNLCSYNNLCSNTHSGYNFHGLKTTTQMDE